MLTRKQFIGRNLRNIKNIKPAKKFIEGNKYVLRPDYDDFNNCTGRIKFLNRYTYWNFEMKRSISKIFPIKIIDINDNKNKDSIYSKKRITFEENNYMRKAYLHPEDFIDVTNFKPTELMMLGRMSHYCNNSVTDKKIIHEILEHNFLIKEPYTGGLIKYKMKFENGKYVLGEQVFEDNLDNFENDIKNSEEKKKMDMKNFNLGNLEEAKKQYELEKANEEIEYAKKQLSYANDNILRLNRNIKMLEDEKQEYLEILKIFEQKEK